MVNRFLFVSFKQCITFKIINSGISFAPSLFQMRMYKMEGTDDEIIYRSTKSLDVAGELGKRGGVSKEIRTSTEYSRSCFFLSVFIFCFFFHTFFFTFYNIISSYIIFIAWYDIIYVLITEKFIFFSGDYIHIHHNTAFSRDTVFDFIGIRGVPDLGMWYAVPWITHYISISI